jgi:hypothetical protein
MTGRKYTGRGILTAWGRCWWIWSWDFLLWPQYSKGCHSQHLCEQSIETTGGEYWAVQWRGRCKNSREMWRGSISRSSFWGLNMLLFLGWWSLGGYDGLGKWPGWEKQVMHTGFWCGNLRKYPHGRLRRRIILRWSLGMCILCIINK